MISSWLNHLHAEYTDIPARMAGIYLINEHGRYTKTGLDPAVFSALMRLVHHDHHWVSAYRPLIEAIIRDPQGETILWALSAMLSPVTMTRLLVVGTMIAPDNVAPMKNAFFQHHRLPEWFTDTFMGSITLE